MSAAIMSVNERQLERIVKGFANHHRIRVLMLLQEQPELSLAQIAEQLKVQMKTMSEHVRRLALSGLVAKRHDGRWVRHKLTKRGVYALALLRKLE